VKCGSIPLRNNVKKLSLSLFLIGISGCAAIPISMPQATSPGFYHKVIPGETLWSISKQYQIPIEELIQTNRLPEAAYIETGQRLYISKDKKKMRLTAIPTNGSLFSWPVEGHVISTFGSHNRGTTNKGIHISSREGTDIVSAQSGKVSFADDSVKGYGKMIIIDHSDHFQTVYAHNSENYVRQGDQVKRNQVIAKVGSSGRANHPYLHFEIRKDYKPKNPFHYLP
jgi:murein DD-endopeptidase MepM/ murein hydrolase activator NlpD